MISTSIHATHLDHIRRPHLLRAAVRQAQQAAHGPGYLRKPPHTLKSVLATLMQAPLYPVSLEIFQASIEFKSFKSGDALSCGSIAMRTAPLNHPNGACGYRIEYGGKAICYITDTEHRGGGPDKTIVELCRGADVMIYDSSYTDAEYPRYRGWGHSTWQEGVRVADAANVGTLAIFHHDPSHDDAFMDGVAREAAALRPGTAPERPAARAGGARRADAQPVSPRFERIFGWRGRWRRLALGLPTILGLSPRGWFLPHRYARLLPPPGSQPPYPVIEALFRREEPAFAAVLDSIDGHAPGARNQALPARAVVVPHLARCGGGLRLRCARANRDASSRSAQPSDATARQGAGRRRRDRGHRPRAARRHRRPCRRASWPRVCAGTRRSSRIRRAGDVLVHDPAHPDAGQRRRHPVRPRAADPAGARWSTSTTSSCPSTIRRSGWRN